MRTFKDFTEEMKLKMIDKKNMPKLDQKDRRAMQYFVKKRRKDLASREAMPEL